MGGEDRFAGGAPQRGRAAIRAVALFEGFKGVLVLALASGALALVHADVDAIAARLVEHAHLNPAAKYPHIFLDAAAHLDQAHLLRLALGAGAYSAMRLVEAYGLWRSRTWAEWLAALGGAVYVPFELIELATKLTPAAAIALAVNLAIVAVMLRAVAARRCERGPSCGEAVLREPVPRSTVQPP